MAYVRPMQINPQGSFLRNIFVCVNDAIDTLGDRRVRQWESPNNYWLKEVLTRSLARCAMSSNYWAETAIYTPTNIIGRERLSKILSHFPSPYKNDQTSAISSSFISTGCVYKQIISISCLTRRERHARRDAKERRNLLNRPIRDENIDECFTKLLMHFTNLIHQSDDESKHSSPSGR